MRAVNVPMRAVLPPAVPDPAVGEPDAGLLHRRKSGKAYRQPVSYARDGETLLTPGGGRWTLNLRTARQVRLRLRGRDVPAHADLVSDPAEVERLLGVIAAGNPRAMRYIPIPRRADGRLEPDALAAAIAHGFRIVRWHLDTASRPHALRASPGWPPHYYGRSSRYRLGVMGVNQHYLFEARQMQALSLAVHIPLVCFGIAFPVLVLFAEWRYLRTGDELYRTLARRWSRIMLALFAVGVVTGTILSFELGLLWPVWMQDFGNVFGLGFTLEGFSFFLEAIFIGIYAYGWDRLSPRAHFLSGIPIAVAGVAGSLFVIAVNGWMNHPSGFTLVNGRATDVHPWQALFANPMFWSEYVHMYFAAYIVCGFLLAGAYAWALPARAARAVRADGARHHAVRRRRSPRRCR